MYAHGLDSPISPTTKYSSSSSEGHQKFQHSAAPLTARVSAVAPTRSARMTRNVGSPKHSDSHNFWYKS